MASILKRPTGSFQVAWRENGKQRTKTFNTKKKKLSVLPACFNPVRWLTSVLHLR